MFGGVTLQKGRRLEEVVGRAGRFAESTETGKIKLADFAMKHLKFVEITTCKVCGKQFFKHQRCSRAEFAIPVSQFPVVRRNVYLQTLSTPVVFVTKLALVIFLPLVAFVPAREDVRFQVALGRKIMQKF